ncbi:MAG TPA: hypothetical protein VFU81_08370, partial [Thermomicrobiales bacterium]|nr:hypothetical protein [Thermomicrobiales bacterium]
FKGKRGFLVLMDRFADAATSASPHERQSDARRTQIGLKNATAQPRSGGRRAASDSRYVGFALRRAARTSQQDVALFGASARSRLRFSCAGQAVVGQPGAIQDLPEAGRRQSPPGLERRRADAGPHRLAIQPRGVNEAIFCGVVMLEVPVDDHGFQQRFRRVARDIDVLHHAAVDFDHDLKRRHSSFSIEIRFSDS